VNNDWSLVSFDVKNPLSEVGHGLRILGNSVVGPNRVVSVSHLQKDLYYIFNQKLKPYNSFDLVLEDFESAQNVIRKDFFLVVPDGYVPFKSRSLMEIGPILLALCLKRLI